MCTSKCCWLCEFWWSFLVDVLADIEAGFCLDCPVGSAGGNLSYLVDCSEKRG